MILPQGYALLRAQAQIDNKFIGWWSSLVCVNEARCMFSIEETNRELVMGSLRIVDCDAVDTMLTEFIRLSGPIKCMYADHQFSDNLLTLMEYMLNSLAPLNYRLVTKVNNGRMQGTDMGVNGIQSIVGYLRLNRPSENAYVLIDLG